MRLGSRKTKPGQPMQHFPTTLPLGTPCGAARHFMRYPQNSQQTAAQAHQLSLHNHPTVSYQVKMPSCGSILLAASAAGLLATQGVAQQVPPLPTASNCKPIYPQVCALIEGEWLGLFESVLPGRRRLVHLEVYLALSLRNPAAPPQCACATAADISCLEISNMYSQVANVSGSSCGGRGGRPDSCACYSRPGTHRSTFTANTTEAT